MGDDVIKVEVFASCAAIEARGTITRQDAHPLRTREAAPRILSAHQHFKRKLISLSFKVSGELRHKLKVRKVRFCEVRALHVNLIGWWW